MSDRANDTGPARLLDPARDPGAVDVTAPAVRPQLLLVCEHAGRLIPARLEGLGLTEAERARHIAWDIGAESVARGLARRLGARLVVQRYSRLVIDCNRPPLGIQSIPEVSDGTRVPGNRGLGEADKAARVSEIFEPYAAALAEEAAAPGLAAMVSIHSFTPVMNGMERPWDIGFCYRSAESRGAGLAAAFRAAHPDLNVADNEPYQIDDETDWFVPRCAEPSGLPHCLIEIRNDRIATEAGAALWADRLAPHLATLAGEPL